MRSRGVGPTGEDGRHDLESTGDHPDPRALRRRRAHRAGGLAGLPPADAAAQVRRVDRRAVEDAERRAQRGSTGLAATADLLDAALADSRDLDDTWGTAAALSVRATIARARGE